MWMLDTDVCIALIKRQPPELIGRLKKHKPGDVAVSSITLAELSFGASKSAQPAKNRAALDQFLLPLCRRAHVGLDRLHEWRARNRGALCAGDHGRARKLHRMPSTLRQRASKALNRTHPLEPSPGMLTRGRQLGEAELEDTRG